MQLPLNVSASCGKGTRGDRSRHLFSLHNTNAQTSSVSEQCSILHWVRYAEWHTTCFMCYKDGIASANKTEIANSFYDSWLEEISSALLVFEVKLEWICQCKPISSQCSWGIVNSSEKLVYMTLCFENDRFSCYIHYSFSCGRWLNQISCTVHVSMSHQREKSFGQQGLWGLWCCLSSSWPTDGSIPAILSSCQ